MKVAGQGVGGAECRENQWTAADGEDTKAYVVRVRETQEYDVEVRARSPRGAAALARESFLKMSVSEQAQNSVGVTDRSFEAVDQLFDEDEFAVEDQ